MAQTSITHVWTLHANDEDPKICQMQALIWLAVLYGENVSLSGPLLLKVNKNGAVLQDTLLVSEQIDFFLLQLFTINDTIQTSSMLSCSLTTDLQDLGYSLLP